MATLLFIISICILARIDTQGLKPRRIKKKEDKAAGEPQSPTKPRGRIMSIFQDQRGSNQQEQNKDDATKDTEDIYEGLEASLTLLLHGLESDWIEEEMADDDDFK